MPPPKPKLNRRRSKILSLMTYDYDKDKYIEQIVSLQKERLDIALDVEASFKDTFEGKDDEITDMFYGALKDITRSRVCLDGLKEKKIHERQMQVLLEVAKYEHEQTKPIREQLRLFIEQEKASL